MPSCDRNERPPSRTMLYADARFSLPGLCTLTRTDMQAPQRIFSYATKWDYPLMVFAALAAMGTLFPTLQSSSRGRSYPNLLPLGSGTTLPLMNVVFGKPSERAFLPCHHRADVSMTRRPRRRLHKIFHARHDYDAGAVPDFTQQNVPIYLLPLPRPFHFDLYQ